MIIAGDGNIDFYSNLQDGWKYGKHMYLDTNGFLFTPSYINIGGNENNNSSPDRVWGSNSSDSYLRSYRTSALRVAYANSAIVWKRTWERNNNCLIDIPSSETRVYMADSNTANKPCPGAGFIIGHGWDWGYGGSMIY